MRTRPFGQLLPILHDKTLRIDGVKLAVDARCAILTAPGKDRLMPGGDCRNERCIGVIATPGDCAGSGPRLAFAGPQGRFAPVVQTST